MAAHPDAHFLCFSTVSGLKNVDPGKFPMHYCYCLNNVTNDLTGWYAREAGNQISLPMAPKSTPQFGICVSVIIFLFCCLDFTALLVDIIGNSTSYLTEIFKSTSILSGLHFFFNIYCCLICMI